MSSTCFGCHKKLSTFIKRGDKKIIIRAGYQPMQEMSDMDVLCQDCLDQIKKTQEKGRVHKERVSIGWQVFITLIFPVYSFWRIEKFTRWFLYSLLIVGGGILSGLGVTLVTDPDSSGWLAGIIIFIAYFGEIPVSVYLIVKWSRKYNENSI